ncbi:MAG: hypothetical protein ACJAZP_000458 [Psychromonas sp.]|jgi:hypothetical protein
MNELKILLTDYQKKHNQRCATFIQKVGYKNISKGLIVLDVFIARPDNNALKYNYVTNMIFRLSLCIKR